MTTFLVKLFVKNSEQVQNPAVRERYGILASSVGIVCNLLLFISKALIGLAIGSISVTADAFNNLSDAASSVISFVGVKLANRPADQEHPFGHGRYEYIAALVVAFLVLQVGFTCFKSSIDKILNPSIVEFKLVLVIILGISILLKVWLGLFNRKLGNRINSTVMKATAADAFGDVVITSVTVVSILVGKLTGLRVDGYMGLVVSAFVLYAGFNIAKDTLEPLIGQAVDPELYEKITSKVESYEGIIGSHDLIVHNYGPSNTMATIHAEVPKSMDVEVAHDIIDGIERDVLREMDIFLVIHTDPLEIDNDTVTNLRETVMELIQHLAKDSTIHDFRVVNGEHHINIIFDLVVPRSYTIEQQQQLVININEMMQEKDARYQCDITVEHGYLGK